MSVHFAWFIQTKNSCFKDLVKKGNSFTVHYKNIQSHAIEVFEIRDNHLKIIINDVLQIRILTYNIRSQTDFARNFVNSSHFGLNLPRYFASKVWNIVPLRIKNAINLHFLKIKQGNYNLKNATVIFVNLTSVIQALLNWCK